METENKRVAVRVKCQITFDDEAKNYVADFTDLNLIARGETADDAVNACKQLFNKYVNGYRRYGELESRLNQSGAEWVWEENCPPEWEDLENTDLLMPGRQGPPVRLSAIIEMVEAQLRPEREFAIAA